MKGENMSSYQKLVNGMSELGIQKMQEYLDYYIDEVNRETDHLQKPWMSLWK
ncbi:MAG: hypothetical protein V8Q42_04770 [Anaerovoracaceae bacterium]